MGVWRRASGAAWLGRSRRRQRKLDATAQGQRATRRGLRLVRATLRRLPRLPLTLPDLHRHPTIRLPHLDPNALRPSRPRHPQEEGRTHLRPSPTRQDRTDRGRLPDRRIPRRPPTRSRPHRRPRHPPLHRPHRHLRANHRGTRRPRRRHQASRDPSILRDPAPRRQQAAAFTAAALPLCRRV